MNSRIVMSAALFAAGALLVFGGIGCQSEKDADWQGTGPAGSVSDINRKMKGQKAGAQDQPAPKATNDILLLVVHDAEGKPLYVETQRSSGDPALDKRAQEYVLKHRRFPKGSANTVVVTLDARRVPKH